MDALLLQKPSSSSDTRHPQPHVHCCSGAQLLDNVTKSLIGVDEWIAQELDRLSHNHLPRNCSNYEALLYVIEGFYQSEQYSAINYRHIEQRSFEEDEDEDEEEEHEYEFEYNNDDDSTYVPAEKSLLSSDINQKPSLQQQEGISSPASVSSEAPQQSSPSHSPANKSEDSNVLKQPQQQKFTKDQLTQKNLILAFSKLIYYCQHESPQFYLNHHRKPLELLIELENVCATKQQDIHACKKRLAHILFGEKIPIIDKLVSSWTIVCLWVQQEIESISQQQKWIIFGVYSYQIAKKVCDIGSTTTTTKVAA